MVKLPGHLRRSAVGADSVPREVMEGHQRERVMKAVIPVFAKRGYQGTTVDDLLASGHIGVGNFYSLFKGKEDCFLEIFSSLVDSAREAVLDAAADSDQWAEQTYLGLRRLLVLVTADQYAARLVLIEAQAAGAEATRRYEALLDAATGWLEAGRATMTRPDALPPTFERSTIAGLAYYLQQCLFSGSAPAPDELLDEVSTVLLAPVTGAEELRRLRSAFTTA
jgi:AcrR family transcriptional regulator